ncbi:MAG: SDR family oxidoreductase [Ectothiorhodospiraceae bacterium]|nr:SDR family oxidoreductase [Ectothiorhodospiraceae bacterium]
MMKRLLDKVAIVTGASSGIGRATAKLFAEEGAKLVVAARRQQELDALVKEISHAGGSAIALAGDVIEESYAEALVDLALQEYGSLDIGFNNAGTLGASGSTPDITLEAWNDTINTNLNGAFLGAKYQIPAMLRAGGSLIFTSSFVGHTIGMPEKAAYAASKAGVIGLTKALATEYGAHSIRVNALVPGGTNTPMAEEFGTSPEVVEFVKQMHALKRTATPEEMAKSALYLASDDSSFTTGTTMLVDGGVSINKT